MCEFVMIFFMEKLEVVGFIGLVGIGRELGLEWDWLFLFIILEFFKGFSLVVIVDCEGLILGLFFCFFLKFFFLLFEFFEYLEFFKFFFDIWY